MHRDNLNLSCAIASDKGCNFEIVILLKERAFQKVCPHGGKLTIKHIAMVNILNTVDYCIPQIPKDITLIILCFMLEEDTGSRQNIISIKKNHYFSNANQFYQ